MHVITEIRSSCGKHSSCHAFCKIGAEIIHSKDPIGNYKSMLDFGIIDDGGS